MNCSKYRILPHMHLIIRCHRGSMNAEDIFRFLVEMSRDRDYDPEFYVLNDFRDCRLNTSKADLLRLINLIGGESKVYGSRKIALLTNSANQVTFGEYIKYLKREDKIDMLTC